ncbi:tail fiber assembly protein [Pseudomonas fluorescens]|nr:tail fiber assembly protein [Pseudomonas fluorescens]
MMKTYANIADGVVQYLLPTDGDIAEMFHPDMIWVDVTEVVSAPVAGWTAVEADGAWSFAAPVPPVLTDAELKAAALSQRDALLSQANEATAGMADAFLADLLSDADKAMFKAYAAYKLALNKIDKQPGYPTTITWPTSP